MKVFILFIIVFFSFSTYGQSSKRLTDELNLVLKDELVRGKQISIRFHKLNHSEINFWEHNHAIDEVLLTKIETTLKKDSILEPFNTYYLHMYWDLYSTEVYTSIGKLVSEGFPNYSNYLPLPRRGFIPFIKNIVADLKRNNFEFANYSKYRDQIEVYVDENGNHTLMGSDKILSYLDSTKLTRWRQALYYGKPIKSIFTIKFVNVQPLSDNPKRIELDECPEIFVWDELYENQLIRFQSGITQIPEGKLIISFVLNTSDNHFENPIIHRGNTDDAKELMNFILKQHPLKNNLYWPEYPKSDRYYFYLK